MKKIMILLAVIAASLFTAQSAQALVLQGDLKVVTYGKGQVTGDGIDCGVDCLETASWDDGQSAPPVILTATATSNGWAPTSYSGCDSLPSMNQCRVNYAAGQQKTVYVHFFDVQAPSVFISGYSSVAGDSLHVNLNVEDNEKITKVEFLLDDDVVVTQTKDFGDTYIDTSDIPEGDHVLTARAVDGNHNVGESRSHVVPVDHTAPEITLDGGPAEGSEVVTGEVAFTWTATDVRMSNQHCSWDGAEAVPCDSRSSKELGPGQHTFEVLAEDQAGNTSSALRTFTVKAAVYPDPDPQPDPKPEPDVADRMAPVVSLVAPKQRLLGLRKGLRINVRCTEACSGPVIVKGRGIHFAGRVTLASAGVAKLKLKPAPKVRKALARISNRNLRSLRKKPVKLTASTVLNDLSGNTGRATLKFRIGA